MEEGIYSNLGHRLSLKNKKSTTPFLLDPKKSFTEMIPRDWEMLDPRDIKLLFFNELKNLLEKDDLVELSKGILDIQRYIDDLEDNIDAKTFKKVPNLERFFKCLSPVLLRTFIDSKKEGTQDMVTALKESIRLALEEEILEHQ